MTYTLRVSSGRHEPVIATRLKQGNNHTGRQFLKDEQHCLRQESSNSEGEGATVANHVLSLSRKQLKGRTSDVSTRPNIYDVTVCLFVVADR